MATNTRQTIRELMLDRYGLGRRGTNTGTSQTAITADASFGGQAGASGIENGSYVMITSGSGAPEDEFSRLSSKPALLTGTMNLDPDLTAALANNDTFEILFRPLVFDAGQGEFSVHEAIADALANYPLFEKRILPITLIEDGDMLKTVTSDWDSDQNGSPTLAKAEGGFPYQYRLLAIVGNTASSPRTRHTGVAVKEGETYYYEVSARMTTASQQGTVILYDSGNAANLTLDNNAVDQTLPTLIINKNVEMPVNVSVVQPSFTLDSGGANTTMSVSDVILRKNSARQFRVQDRPAVFGYLGRLLITTIDKLEERGDRWREVVAEPHMVGNGILEYSTKENLSGLSVWYEEFLQQADMTGDTDTTPIIKDHLAAIAAEKLLFPIQGRSDEWRARYLKATRDAAHFEMNLYEQQRSTVQAQRVVFQARV